MENKLNMKKLNRDIISATTSQPTLLPASSLHFKSPSAADARPSSGPRNNRSSSRTEKGSQSKKNFILRNKRSVQKQTKTSSINLAQYLSKKKDPGGTSSVEKEANIQKTEPAISMFDCPPDDDERKPNSSRNGGSCINETMNSARVNSSNLSSSHLGGSKPFFQYNPSNSKNIMAYPSLLDSASPSLSKVLPTATAKSKKRRSRSPAAANREEELQMNLVLSTGANPSIFQMSAMMADSSSSQNKAMPPLMQKKQKYRRQPAGSKFTIVPAHHGRTASAGAKKSQRGLRSSRSKEKSKSKKKDPRAFHPDQELPFDENRETLGLFLDLDEDPFKRKDVLEFNDGNDEARKRVASRPKAYSESSSTDKEDYDYKVIDNRYHTFQTYQSAKHCIFQQQTQQIFTQQFLDENQTTNSILLPNPASELVLPKQSSAVTSQVQSNTIHKYLVKDPSAMPSAIPSVLPSAVASAIASATQENLPFSSNDEYSVGEENPAAPDTPALSGEADLISSDGCQDILSENVYPRDEVVDASSREHFSHEQSSVIKPSVCSSSAMRSHFGKQSGQSHTPLNANLMQGSSNVASSTKSRTKRKSPVSSVGNFHDYFLKFGIWPDMSYQKVSELRRAYKQGELPTTAAATGSFLPTPSQQGVSPFRDRSSPSRVGVSYFRPSHERDLRILRADILDEENVKSSAKKIDRRQNLQPNANFNASGGRLGQHSNPRPRPNNKVLEMGSPHGRQNLQSKLLNLHTYNSARGTLKPKAPSHVGSLGHQPMIIQRFSSNMRGGAPERSKLYEELSMTQRKKKLRLSNSRSGSRHGSRQGGSRQGDKLSAFSGGQYNTCPGVKPTNLQAYYSGGAGISHTAAPPHNDTFSLTASMSKTQGMNGTDPLSTTRGARKRPNVPKPSQNSNNKTTQRSMLEMEKKFESPSPAIARNLFEHMMSLPKELKGEFSNFLSSRNRNLVSAENNSSRVYKSPSLPSMTHTGQTANPRKVVEPLMVLSDKPSEKQLTGFLAEPRIMQEQPQISQSTQKTQQDAEDDSIEREPSEPKRQHEEPVGARSYIMNGLRMTEIVETKSMEMNSADFQNSQTLTKSLSKSGQVVSYEHERMLEQPIITELTSNEKTSTVKKLEEEYKKKIEALDELLARVQSQRNPGQVGGPVVRKFGELVEDSIVGESGFLKQMHSTEGPSCAPFQNLETSTNQVVDEESGARINKEFPAGQNQFKAMRPLQEFLAMNGAKTSTVSASCVRNELSQGDIGANEQEKTRLGILLNSGKKPIPEQESGEYGIEQRIERLISEKRATAFVQAEKKPNNSTFLGEQPSINFSQNSLSYIDPSKNTIDSRASRRKRLRQQLSNEGNERSMVSIRSQRSQSPPLILQRLLNQEANLSVIKSNEKEPGAEHTLQSSYNRTQRSRFSSNRKNRPSSSKGVTNVIKDLIKQAKSSAKECPPSGTD